MDGLFGTDSPSLRPGDATAPLPSLPRRVLRHLVTVHGLGVGSRVVIGGDESRAVASFFERLGVDATAADDAGQLSGCDAALWLDLEPSPAGERSLLGTTALEQSADLLTCLQPFGTFLMVARLGDAGVGHQPACLEGHLACFSERSRLTVFPERTFGGFFGGSSRPAWAVASCQISTSVEDPLARHRLALVAGSAECEDYCCNWSAQPTRQTRAA